MQKFSPVGNSEETRHHLKVLRMGTGFIVGYPSEEPRYHEGLGWAQAPHGSSRTWDTESAHFLLYHVLFSSNSQSKSFLLGLKSENEWSCVELKAPGKMGFKSRSSSCHLIVWPVGAPNPQAPHTIISWQKDVTCSHSSPSASLFKAFWLLVRKWFCLAVTSSPSPFCLWGLVRKCFHCSYTSTSSISEALTGKKKRLSPISCWW